MYDVLDIAAYVIHKYWIQGSPITNLKLQKVLYYIQGYSIRRNNSPAFSESIYRWPYGPVVPQVYFAYNSSRAKAIPEPATECINRLTKVFQKDKVATRVIDAVISRSFTYTAAQMVDMTHKEDPWKQASDSSVIPVEAMYSYFSSHDPLNIERI